MNTLVELDQSISPEYLSFIDITIQRGFEKVNNRHRNKYSDVYQILHLPLISCSLISHHSEFVVNWPNMIDKWNSFCSSRISHL